MKEYVATLFCASHTVFPETMEVFSKCYNSNNNDLEKCQKEYQQVIEESEELFRKFSN